MLRKVLASLVLLAFLSEVSVSVDGFSIHPHGRNVGLSRTNNDRVDLEDGRRRTVYTNVVNHNNKHGKRGEKVVLGGIKGFRSWLDSQFPSAITPLPTQGSHSSDEFDHVLIDVNQLLHVTLRRSRSEGHALTMVLKELDKCCTLAMPKRSIVLAFDGPPSAAKLATQRRRRYGSVVRSEYKKERLDYLMKRGIYGPQFGDDPPNQNPNAKKRKPYKAFASEYYSDHEMNADGSSASMNPSSHSKELQEQQQKEDEDDHKIFLSSLSVKAKRERSKRRERYSREAATLCITPGTLFMEKAHEAFLYWAWQRMSVPWSRMQLENIHVYLSPSLAPGEGEVKLLDWVLQAGQNGIVQPGDSVAIMGGDSDLVLEALVIPPKITHNIFVILPEGTKRMSFSVSLWEMTRTLSRFLPNLQPKDMMRIRTDLVLLLIMNGNDYLPKLRGSSGFNKMFHTYLRVVKEWIHKEEKQRLQRGGDPSTDDEGVVRPFMVDPDAMQFNLPFCVALFRKLSMDMSQKSFNDQNTPPTTFERFTPLSYLNDMVQNGFFPKPIRWEVLNGDEDTVMSLQKWFEIPGNDDNTRNSSNNSHSTTKEDDPDDCDKNDDNDAGNGEKGGNNHQIVRLLLGSPDDANVKGHFYQFEVKHRPNSSMARTKQKLSDLALQEILGPDYMDSRDYDVTASSSSSSSESDDGGDEESIGTYAWELSYPAPADVEAYLEGLLWNLETYLEGVCADYGYNYGRRLSPSSTDVFNYMMDAMENQKVVGRHELFGNFTAPISAGLSCLAALPSQVRHLLPEPYQWLADEGMVEDIYTSCMDLDTNVFDIQRFEQLCYERIEELKKGRDGDVNGVGHEKNKASRSSKEGEEDRHSKERRIVTGEKFWTVISKSQKPLTHPFAPPDPFCDRVSKLSPNRRLKSTHITATAQPRWRTQMRDTKEGHTQMHGSLTQRAIKQKQKGKESVQEDENQMSHLLKDENSRIEDIRYYRPYSTAKFIDKAKRKNQKGAINDPFADEEKDLSIIGSKKGRTTSSTVNGIGAGAEVSISKQNMAANGDTDAMKKLKVLCSTHPSESVIINAQKHSAVAVLQQLEDAKIIEGVKWMIYNKAESNPKKGESIEKVRLRFQDKVSGAERSYRQDRFPSVSRRALKQHLASLALHDLVGFEQTWTKMDSEEIRDYLNKQNPASRTNPSNQSPLQKLGILADVKLIGSVNLSYGPIEGKQESIRLDVELLDDEPANGSNKGKLLSYQEARNLDKQTRGAIKRSLATKAMDELFVGTSTPWTSMSARELRTYLRQKRKEQSSTSSFVPSSLPNAQTKDKQ